MITDRHAGKRFFVCGSSPHIHTLDNSHLANGVTIGINEFPRHYRDVDYLICYDSPNLITKKGFASFVKSLKAEKFFRKDPKIVEMYHNQSRVVTEFFTDLPALVTNPIPKEWDGKLIHIGTTAVDACHLAYIMGASEIVLWGVDLFGGARFDGSTYSSENYWDLFRDRIESVLHRFPIPVYKTNEASPLKLPFMDFSKNVA